MTDRKKPGWAFWATVAVVVALVGYPLSSGPMIWLAMKADAPLWVFNVLEQAYGPLLGLAMWSGDVGQIYLRYFGWWTMTAD
jgi:hypothetical protein